MRCLCLATLLVMSLAFATSASAQIVYFEENFDDNSAGWTLGTEWQIGPAVWGGGASSSCGAGDPAYDADGPGGTEGIAGVVIGGSAGTTLHPFYYLTSPPINTTGASSLFLEFSRWLNSDYTPYMQNVVEVYDGAVWNVIWQTGAGPTFQEVNWAHQAHDISAYSNAALQVRFGFNVNNAGAYSTCGSWNIDDVQVTTIPNAYFVDDFDNNRESWVFDPEWQIGPATASPPAGACGSGDPGYDADGPGGTDGIAGVIIGGTASTPIHPFYYITSRTISTDGATSLVLEFDRWLNSDYTPYMQNSVEVFDGVAWVPIWQSGPSPGVTESTWSHHLFDIAVYSNPALQVRFGFNIDSGGVYTCSGWNLDNVVIAPDPLDLPTPYLKDSFDDNSAEWTLGAEWQIGTATSSAAGVCGNGDPDSDADGPAGTNGVAGVVLGGPAGTALHPFEYLTSPPVSTVDSTDLTLEFDRWLNSDYDPYMQNRVEVFDGIDWVVLWESGGPPSVEDAAWTHHVFDLGPFSNAALQVRFGFDVDSTGVYTDCGSWNLDNVCIDDAPPVPLDLFIRGDTNASGSVDIADAVNLLSNLFPPAQIPITCADTGDANDSGAIDIADAITILATLFPDGSTPPIQAPYPACGEDLSADALDCASFPPCP